MAGCARDGSEAARVPPPTRGALAPGAGAFRNSARYYVQLPGRRSSIGRTGAVAGHRERRRGRCDPRRAGGSSSWACTSAGSSCGVIAAYRSGRPAVVRRRRSPTPTSRPTWFAPAEAGPEADRDRGARSERCVRRWSAGRDRRDPWDPRHHRRRDRDRALRARHAPLAAGPALWPSRPASRRTASGLARQSVALPRAGRGHPVPRGRLTPGTRDRVARGRGAGVRAAHRRRAEQCSRSFHTDLAGPRGSAGAPLPTRHRADAAAEVAPAEARTSGVPARSPDDDRLGRAAPHHTLRPTHRRRRRDPRPRRAQHRARRHRDHRPRADRRRPRRPLDGARPRAVVRGRRRRGGHHARRAPARPLDRGAGEAVPDPWRDHRRGPRPGRHRHPRPSPRPVPLGAQGFVAAAPARGRAALPAGRDRGLTRDPRKAVARARVRFAEEHGLARVGKSPTPTTSRASGSATRPSTATMAPRSGPRSKADDPAPRLVPPDRPQVGTFQKQAPQTAATPRHLGRRLLPRRRRPRPRYRATAAS